MDWQFEVRIEPNTDALPLFYSYFTLVIRKLLVIAWYIHLDATVN